MNRDRQGHQFCCDDCSSNVQGLFVFCPRLNNLSSFRLQIIRGRTLFKLNIKDDKFGLFITYSQMHTLELPALRDILAGSVGVFNAYNLCHIRTINWDEIITGKCFNLCGTIEETIQCKTLAQ